MDMVKVEQVVVEIDEKNTLEDIKPSMVAPVPSCKKIFTVHSIPVMCDSAFEHISSQLVIFWCRSN